MAYPLQRPVMEINNSYHDVSGLRFYHLLLAMLDAIRRGERYQPEKARDLYPSKEELPLAVVRWLRQGWILLDHAAEYKETEWSFARSSRDWLDVDQCPHDVGRSRMQIEEQRWSPENRQSLIVIPWFESCFIHCDRQAGLSPVPDDLAKVVDWAIGQRIEWIDAYCAGKIYA